MKFSEHDTCDDCWIGIPKVFGFDIIHCFENYDPECHVFRFIGYPRQTDLATGRSLLQPREMRWNSSVVAFGPLVSNLLA